jgi:hypothetical protein
MIKVAFFYKEDTYSPVHISMITWLYRYGSLEGSGPWLAKTSVSMLRPAGTSVEEEGEGKEDTYVRGSFFRFSGHSSVRRESEEKVCMCVCVCVCVWEPLSMSPIKSTVTLKTCYYRGKKGSFQILADKRVKYPNGYQKLSHSKSPHRLTLILIFSKHPSISSFSSIPFIFQYPWCSPFVLSLDVVPWCCPLTLC